MERKFIGSKPPVSRRHVIEHWPLMPSRTEQGAEMSIAELIERYTSGRSLDVHNYNEQLEALSPDIPNPLNRIGGDLADVSVYENAVKSMLQSHRKASSAPDHAAAPADTDPNVSPPAAPAAG